MIHVGEAHNAHSFPPVDTYAAPERVSRAALSVLAEAQFPAIAFATSNDEGNETGLVDRLLSPFSPHERRRLDLQLEMSDDLHQHHIVFQFQAISQASSPSSSWFQPLGSQRASAVPIRAVISFQLYQSAYRSPLLLVSNPADRENEGVLPRILYDKQHAEYVPGLMVRDC
jgi:hypothetical protein